MGQRKLVVVVFLRGIAVVGIAEEIFVRYRINISVYRDNAPIKYALMTQVFAVVGQLTAVRDHPGKCWCDQLASTVNVITEATSVLGGNVQAISKIIAERAGGIDCGAIKVIATDADIQHMCRSELWLFGHDIEGAARFTVTVQRC